MDRNYHTRSALLLINNQHLRGSLDQPGSPETASTRCMNWDNASDPQKVFGWIGVAISLIYKVPQIIKLQKTRRTAGISVFSQIVQASAYFFYIAHGILIRDPPILFLGCTSLLQSLVLITQYFCFKDLPHNLADNEASEKRLLREKEERAGGYNKQPTEDQEQLEEIDSRISVNSDRKVDKL